jgi:hypothetical protein
LEEREMTKILDDLERLLPTIDARVKEHDQAHFVLDGYESLQLAERNFVTTVLSVVPALPALIRVARAAEVLDSAWGPDRHDAEVKLTQALKQLRDLGEGR